MAANPLDRRRLLGALLAGGPVAALGACGRQPAAGNEPCNPLLWALAWQQTAAEFQALCYQACNLARLRLDQQLAQQKVGDRPLAVITDIDNTLLHANSYWGYLVAEGQAFFDDAAWDEWLPENLATAVPGTLDLLQYCEQQNVDVFYVSNRDQGERSDEYALRQLAELQFPFADPEHLYLFRHTSDKSSATEAIAQRFNIALMMGDNLNDFRRDYYVIDIDERRALMERDRDDWGKRFILFPNPTDGHWVRAIFGESEPADTPANRRRLQEAASRTAWDGHRGK